MKVLQDIQCIEFENGLNVYPAIQVPRSCGSYARGMGRNL